MPPKLEMQSKKLRRLAIDLTLALIAVTGTAIGSAPDDSAYFSALSAVYNLAEVKDKIAPETAFPEATTILEEASNLNLSTANDGYFDAADDIYHQGGKVKDQEGLKQW